MELIDPFDSGATSDGQGKPVVVVVRPTSFGEVFAGFPGFGRFPGFNSFPRGLERVSILILVLMRSLVETRRNP